MSNEDLVHDQQEVRSPEAFRQVSLVLVGVPRFSGAICSFGPLEPRIYHSG